MIPSASRKLFIVGSVASGKTTLAARLSDQLGIPWFELDSIVHVPTAEGRIKRTPEQQMEAIMEIDPRGTWIFEGTDRASHQCLYGMADTVLFVDTPLWKRRLRIFTRFLKQNLGLEACHYKPDLDMLRAMYRWTHDFERGRTEFEAKLRLYGPKVVRLQGNELQDVYETLQH